MGIEMEKWRHGEGERETDRQMSSRREIRTKTADQPGPGRWRYRRRDSWTERGRKKLHKQTTRETETAAETEATRDINRQGRLKR